MAFIKALFGSSENIAEAFRQKDITSDEMKTAIKEWFSEYFKNDTDEIENPCQRLPFVITNKLNKTVFSEYDADIIDPITSKDLWQFGNLRMLNKIKAEVLQWACIGGECLIKPVFNSNGGFSFLPIRRDSFFVFGRKADGSLSSVGFLERTVVQNGYYTLLEKRTASSEGLKIEYKLFYSMTKTELGERTELASIYPDLRDESIIPQIKDIGLVCVKIPTANCVDGSADGVSIYAPALELIKQININEKQLSDEFEVTQSRIVVSEDLLDKTLDGDYKLNKKLFIGLTDMPNNVGVNIFSPQIRQESYENRRQAYLKACENIIGFKRGILSDVEATERTATEITSSAGDYAIAINELQRMWYDAVVSTLKLCDELGAIYKLCDNSVFEVTEKLSVTWGNGVLYDTEKEWQTRLLMVQAGLLKPELAIAWKFDLPCETDEDLLKIREKYMPAIADI